MVGGMQPGMQGGMQGGRMQGPGGMQGSRMQGPGGMQGGMNPGMQGGMQGMQGMQTMQGTMILSLLYFKISYSVFIMYVVLHVEVVENSVSLQSLSLKYLGSLIIIEHNLYIITYNKATLFTVFFKNLNYFVRSVEECNVDKKVYPQ